MLWDNGIAKDLADYVKLKQLRAILGAYWKSLITFNKMSPMSDI